MLSLEHAADVDFFNDHKVTPLQEASRRSHLDIVELVLDHDANVDNHDENGDTPLSWASLRRRTGCYSSITAGKGRCAHF